MQANVSWRVTERTRYSEAYGHDYHPSDGSLFWRLLCRAFPDRSEIKEVLDVGCGFGDGVAYCRLQGLKSYGVDFAEPLLREWQSRGITDYCAFASADCLPFKDNSFDLVGSFDVLEHIPEDAVPDVLSEINRVSRKHFFFCISLVPALNKMFDGSEPHICIKEEGWWLDKVAQSGADVKTIGRNGSEAAIAFHAVKKGKVYEG